MCIKRIKLAHKAYKEAKNDASKWRTSVQETFVTDKAKERGLSEEVVIKTKRNMKKSRRKRV